MTIIKTCCCFDNVWKGSFACGVYTLIFYSLTIASEITTIFAIDAHLNGNATSETANNILFKMGYMTKAHQIFSIINVCVCCCIVTASIILLVGLHGNKRQYLVPWIYAMLFDLCFGFIHTAYFIFNGFGSAKSIMASAIGIYFLIVMLNIYCIVCVVSQYQYYKEGYPARHNWRENVGVVYTTTYNNIPVPGRVA